MNTNTSRYARTSQRASERCARRQLYGDMAYTCRSVSRCVVDHDGGSVRHSKVLAGAGPERCEELVLQIAAKASLHERLEIRRTVSPGPQA